MRHVSTPEVHAFFSNSGSLAIFAAIRRVPRKPHINHGYLDYGTKLRRGTLWQ